MSQKIFRIFNILLSLFLGWTLFWGGVKKFDKPIPAPTAQMESIKKGEFDTLDLSTLRLKNYVFGMKQTGYFWAVLGIGEIAVGLLLFSQLFRFVGAVAGFPITLQIFLFHFFLEPNDLPALLETHAMLLINIWLIAVEFPRWKHLVFNKSIL
jgi:uncharacterized membrane protein YphA (DoxX/SURF4 family)